MDQSPAAPRAPPNTPVQRLGWWPDGVLAEPDTRFTPPYTTLSALANLASLTQLHTTLHDDIQSISNLYTALGELYHSFAPLLPVPDQVHQAHLPWTPGQVHVVPLASLEALFTVHFSEEGPFHSDILRLPSLEHGPTNFFLSRLSAVKESLIHVNRAALVHGSVEGYPEVQATMELADEVLDELKERLVTAEFYMEAVEGLTETGTGEGSGRQRYWAAQKRDWDEAVEVLRRIGQRRTGWDVTDADRAAIRY
ncbi:hypothetical protein TI39_contig278g00054 [Zymoseptoria brevis]|uniref:Uncharacterized protein n=1 Tax=Zymoseptoria brevis TaxID=1047168 RepID=A0A0F4GWM5_9PEZI|nr:hypothetical protein TI39_contig278g00054 [Zymoseptoria brevis]